MNKKETEVKKLLQELIKDKEIKEYATTYFFNGLNIKINMGVKSDNHEKDLNFINSRIFGKVFLLYKNKYEYKAGYLYSRYYYIKNEYYNTLFKINLKRIKNIAKKSIKMAKINKNIKDLKREFRKIEKTINKNI